MRHSLSDIFSHSDLPPSEYHYKSTRNATTENTSSWTREPSFPTKALAREKESKARSNGAEQNALYLDLTPAKRSRLPLHEGLPIPEPADPRSCPSLPPPSPEPRHSFFNQPPNPLLPPNHRSTPSRGTNASQTVEAGASRSPVVLEEGGWEMERARKELATMAVVAAGGRVGGKVERPRLPRRHTREQDF